VLLDSEFDSFAGALAPSIAKALRLKTAGVTHLNIWPDSAYEVVHEGRLDEVIKMLGLLRQALD
jgi:hypothetical protein